MLPERHNNALRWSSICRGATIWGLEHSEQSPATKKTVVRRIARYSYGLMYSVLFDESKGHLFQDRRQDPNGDWLAINQMGWLLEKGDRVEEGRLLHKRLTKSIQVSKLSTGMKYFTDELYYCADSEPPSRYESSEYCFR